MSSRTTTYLCYRCLACHRLITRYDILRAWEEAKSAALCPCGGGKISPSNPTLWEEITLPRVWRLWWGEVFLPWLRKRLGW